MKILKRLFQIFMALIVVLVVTIIGVVLFVNPNQFKETIEKQTLVHTGHKLTINGEMSWRFFPMLALELKEIELENRVPFKGKFISSKLIKASLSFESLLARKAFFNLNLEDAQVALVKNSKGAANWENFIQPENEKPIDDALESKNIAKSEVQSPEDNKNKEKNKTFSVMLNNIEIKNAEITYQDEEKNKRYKINQLTLTAEKIVESLKGAPHPLSLKMQVDFNKETEGALSLEAKWSLNSEEDSLKIQNLIVKFEFPNGKVTSLQGEALVQNLSKNPSVVGKLNGKDFNVKPFLGSDTSNLPLEGDIKTAFEYKAPFLALKNLQVDLKNNGSILGNLKVNVNKINPGALTLEGDFNAKDLNFNKIKLEEIKANLNGKEGVINIAPLEIHIAETVQHASMQLDLRGTQPKFTITDEAKNFEIKNLLALFDIKDKIEGKTNLKLNLSASGSTPVEIKRTLSGSVQIDLNNGKLYGVNLIKILKSAQASTHAVLTSILHKPEQNLVQQVSSLDEEIKKNTATDKGDTTPFDSIKANMVIQNGLIKNPLLAIDHTEYSVKGEGQANIVNEEIQYQVAVLLKNNPYPENDSVGNYLYKTSLPVKISGTFSNPSIRPDYKAYTKSALDYVKKTVVKNAVQKNLNKVVEKSMGKFLKGVVQEPSEEPSQTGGSNTTAPQEQDKNPKLKDAVTDHLNKALGNILK